MGIRLRLLLLVLSATLLSGKVAQFYYHSHSHDSPCTICIAAAARRELTDSDEMVFGYSAAAGGQPPKLVIIDSDIANAFLPDLASAHLPSPIKFQILPEHDAPTMDGMRAPGAPRGPPPLS